MSTDDIPSTDDTPSGSQTPPKSDTKPALLTIHRRARSLSPLQLMRSLFSQKIAHADTDYVTTKGKLAYSMRTTFVDGQKVTSLFRHSSSSSTGSRDDQGSWSSNNTTLKEMTLTPVATITWTKKVSDFNKSTLLIQHPDTGEQKMQLNETLSCFMLDEAKLCSFTDSSKKTLYWKKQEKNYQLTDCFSNILGDCVKMSLSGDRYILILQTQDKPITSPDFYIVVMALYCLMTCFGALSESNRESNSNPFALPRESIPEE